jgi:hypothetical protein
MWSIKSLAALAIVFATSLALEHSFTDRMGSFLQGRLQEPISYDLRSEPALQTVPKLNAN